MCQKRETLGEQLASASPASSSCTQVVSNWVKVPLQIHAHPVPQNAAIFGHSIFADVVSGDGLGLGKLSPKSGDCCPQKTTRRHGEGGCDSSGRVSIKGLRGPWPRRSLGEAGRALCRRLGTKPVPSRPGSWSLAPRMWMKVFVSTILVGAVRLFLETYSSSGSELSLASSSPDVSGPRESFLSCGPRLWCFS